MKQDKKGNAKLIKKWVNSSKFSRHIYRSESPVVTVNVSLRYADGQAD